MIWRVVVVLICIVIVVSAVWAASDSFEVRLDSPNTFGEDYIIPTPTPMPIFVNYPFRMESSQIGTESIFVDMRLPTTHVVLMKGNRVRQLDRFHLCRGTLRRCTGGIESFDANYIDLQGDGIADRLRVYFTWEDFQTLLSTTDTDETDPGMADPDSTDSTFDDAVTSDALTSDALTSTAVISVATTPNVPSARLDPSTDRYTGIRLTISGDVYAWKIAQP